MKPVESYRKVCLRQQTELRRLMTGTGQHARVLQFFLRQHAMLHSQKVEPTGPWSFEDEILNDLPEAQIRRVPQGREHSIAWLIWHIARCEDVTMNLLVAGTPQVLHKGGWLEQMKITACDTGNAMDQASLTDFSHAIDLEALRKYRVAVGRRTREIVKPLLPADLKRKVEPARIQQVMREGAVLEAAHAIVDYWSKRTVAGLLLMPATRHNLFHLNEALQLKHLRIRK